MTLRWVCLHCHRWETVETTALDCADPKCSADVHSAWIECEACGWETRVVRHTEGTTGSTHTKRSSTGIAGTA